jgi:hypothetical protein
MKSNMSQMTKDAYLIWLENIPHEKRPSDQEAPIFQEAFAIGYLQGMIRAAEDIKIGSLVLDE